MKKEGSLKALLPLLVFLIVYISISAIAGDMYAVSVIIPFSASAITALIMNRNKSLNEKLDIFCTGAGENNVILMVLIFILAGAFAQVAKDMGAVDSTVNLGLSILPSGLLVVGLFLIACFIALSVGTSVGTIVALVPIATAVSEKTGVLLAIAVGAVVSGAMFGDNLSIISDTTIAATRTQGCDMKDKFRMNFRIVLPAAILTTIIFWAITLNSGAAVMEQLEFSLIKIIPYLVVIISALCGMNVVLILVLGIILAGGIGIYYGAFDIISLCQSMANGISGMSELIIVTLLMAGT
ncbi:MAG TPA: sodium:proton antiporter, partial [Clostridium sp.]|nr:sodium:proton antiporter [Clostridium sp.]